MRLATSLLVLQQLGTCFAQVSSVVSLSNGARLRIITNSGTGTAGPLKAELKPASGNSIYRIFRDETGLAVYAYELVVERLPDEDHFRITARPAGTEFAARFPYTDGGKPTPTLSRAIESPPLDAGGRFTIDIPTNPGLFEHRTDTVQIQPDQRGASSADSGSQPVARLRFVGLKVSINGKPVPLTGGGAIVSGQYAMFYIPRRGGYFFSTEPVDHPVFIRAATVDRTRLQFTIDNDIYECNSEAQILLKSDRGEIWVYHDRRYKPSGNWTRNNPNPKSPDEFFTAASDSLQWWLP